MLPVLLENRFNHRWVDYYEALPGQILASDMAQKVATERKMKLRQETTSVGQIATVTAKPRISDKERWFITRRSNFRQFSLAS